MVPQSDVLVLLLLEGLFVDKAELLHEVVLISNIKGMWGLELSIH